MKEGELPDGLIYEDIVEVLMVLFRSQFTTNRGQDYEGGDDPNITPAMILDSKEQMR